MLLPLRPHPRPLPFSKGPCTLQLRLARRLLCAYTVFPVGILLYAFERRPMYPPTRANEMMSMMNGVKGARTCGLSRFF